MIRCGHCKGDHASVADVRACAIDSGALTGEANDSLPLSWYQAEEPVRLRLYDEPRWSDWGPITFEVEPKPADPEERGLKALASVHLKNLRWSRP